MSNLDKIIDNIVSEAQKEVDSLIAQAEEKAKANREQMLEGLNKELTNKEASKETMALQIQDRIRTGAEREVRNEVLQAKQDTVSRAFDLAKKELMGMDDAAYQAIIDKTLSNRTFDPSTVLEIPSFRTYTTDKVTVKKVDDLKSGFRIVKGGVRDNYDFNEVVDSLRGSMDATVLSLIEER